jgi:YVTN family beta-propeller protein
LFCLSLTIGCPKPPQASSKPTGGPATQGVPSVPVVEANSVTFPKDAPPSFTTDPPAVDAKLGYQSVGAIWTVDFEGAFVLAIEPKTGKLLGQAKTWPRPHDVLVSADGKRVWVSAVGVEDDADGVEENTQPAGNDDGEIWVYNAETLEIEKKLRPGRYPGHMAVRPDGNYMFASLAGDDAIAVIDMHQPKVIGRIPVADGPRGLAVSPDGKRLAVACSKAGVVSVINLMTLTREFEIAVGERPTQVGFSLDSSTFYVTVLGNNKLKAFELNTKKFVWEVEVSYGMGHITVSPSNGNIYIADSASNSLVIIDPRERKQVASWYAGNGTHAVALSLDQTVAYVSNGIDQTVAEITKEGKESPLATKGLLRGIAVGPAPKQVKVVEVVAPIVPVKVAPKIDDAKVRYGRSVFKKYCDPCHPQGKQKIGPQIKGKSLSRKRIVNQVRNGSDIMPAFEDSILSATELEGIVAYLQAP